MILGLEKEQINLALSFEITSVLLKVVFNSQGSFFPKVAKSPIIV